MTLKLTSGASMRTVSSLPIRVVIVTMDTHLASSVERARKSLAKELPHLTLTLHAASEYTGNDALVARCKADIAQADIVVAGMLFLEDHFLPILEDLRARRMQCDAMICIASATEVTQLTRLGQFDMLKPASGPMALLKKLRGSKEKAPTGGAAQMKMLRRLPQMLRFIPGTAQDVRAYFLAMQYWMSGSDDNVLNLVRHVVDRGADGARRSLRGSLKIDAPVHYPEVGVYHPRMAGRYAEDVMALPLPAGGAVQGTVGLLLMRSYLLAGNAGHYDGVIASLEARGLRVLLLSDPKLNVSSAALAVNVGSAGAFVTFNGALGTPSSGTVTNLTGTASGLTAGTVTGPAPAPRRPAWSRRSSRTCRSEAGSGSCPTTRR